MCMGFSPTPRNEVLSSPASAARGPASLTTSLWRRRSTLSPPILKCISILTGFLRSRDNKCHQGQSRPMNTAGPAIEGERAPDVLGTRRAACADPGVADRNSRIDPRAAQPHAEGARERRLGPAGIGGGVAARVVPHGAPRGPGRSVPCDQRCDDDPYNGHPRGKKIDEIVELRRGEAESLKPLRPVANHAVGGVDGLVARSAGKAAKREPEGGCHDAVRKILGEAFDRGAGDACRVEAHSVAANDFCDSGAAGRQTFFEGAGGGKDMRIAAPLRDEARRDKRRDGEVSGARWNLGG